MRLLSLFVILGTLAASCLAKDPATTSGTGGAVGSGGVTGTGGKPGTGGATSTGGKTGMGGATSTGGTTGTGGSSVPTSVDCADTSTYSSLVVGQYGTTQIPVDNNSNKNYYMQANWYGNPSPAPQEQLSGLGFGISGSVSASGNSVIGYPSIYVGSYQGRATKGSGLPKQISSLTSVPTIFSTNVDSMGSTDYIADYDVWLTANGNVVTGTDPGTDGAYLMVWLFKPSNKQPRGSAIADGRIVDGVPGAWTVWADTTNPPCVSYVSITKSAELQFDLNYFIQDAIKMKYGNIKSSQYLSIIFAGFEVWAGGDGLKIKQFCANVK
jgi:cellulose 1,4-beta-cellobiosidase